jgi:hypothetical protein
MSLGARMKQYIQERAATKRGQHHHPQVPLSVAKKWQYEVDALEGQNELLTYQRDRLIDFAIQSEAGRALMPELMQLPESAEEETA